MGKGPEHTFLPRQLGRGADKDQAGFMAIGTRMQSWQKNK